ncbi:DUF3558 domain-containing protein [Nocardia brasiliensis]|uniref:DUF3558 domain-containing protein n=1 Tax=Nocardia brasiliensis TaxID=37326 RepID=A0A6G9XV88_NOCBR|nr:DUF3558 domain-containing protein [Nocardia brasiliensis]
MPSAGTIIRTLTIIVGAALVLGGCDDTSGTPSTSGAPSTSATTSVGVPVKDQAPWDPCSLPVDALRATGLDPDSKKSGAAGVEFDGWKVCRWRAQTRWYSLGVLAGTPTLKDVQNRSDFNGFKSFQVGGRPAVQFGRASDPERLGCSVAVEVPAGSVIFDMLTRYGEPQQADPCSVAAKHANDLAKYLP